MLKCLRVLGVLMVLSSSATAQVTPETDHLFPKEDSTLRIVNLNPDFVQHIDSQLVYQFRINLNPTDYYWYLTNAPVGLTINRATGLVSFRAAKNYFLSGKLKYDFPYRVGLTVRSMLNREEKLDTAFNISFYNTDVIPSKMKLSVSGNLEVEEGEQVGFKVQCENGTTPFENIIFSSSVPITDVVPAKFCNDDFKWTPSFDFVKDVDMTKKRTVTLSFIGTTRTGARDTASVNITVKNGIDYPRAKAEYDQVYKNVQVYVLQIKYAFLQLDKGLKKTKRTRTGFDLTSASTALTGTILGNSDATSDQKVGRILPGVGVALVPVKEATAPNKNVEQNQATMIRGFIKRLEYFLTDNMVVSDKDPAIVSKTNKLRDELKQIQVQLIDVPVDINNSMTEKQLNDYFNSPKVNKKYRLKR